MISACDFDNTSSVPLYALVIIKKDFKNIIAISTRPDDWKKFMQRIGIHHYECNHTISEVGKLFSEFKSSLKNINNSFNLLNPNERVNTFYNKIVILPDPRGKYILSKHDVFKFFDNHISKISDISEDLVESVNNVLNTVNLAIATHIVNTRIHIQYTVVCWVC